MKTLFGRFANTTPRARARPGPAAALCALAALALAACDGPAEGEGSARKAAASSLRDQLLVVRSEAPQIIVDDRSDLDRAARFGRALDTGEILSRLDAREARADSVAWMTGSRPGRAFLAAEPPRAIARGDPAEMCPATGIAGAADAPEGSPAGRRAAVTRLALERCLGALEDRPGECGCKLLAVDRVLTVPLEEMAYATGVTARLRAPELGIDGVLIAEEDESGAILLRDLSGPVARLERLDGDRARLAFADGGATLEGTREAVGWRRGRLAERIYLEDEAGRRAALLIGFSPGELAASAAAALAWPGGG
jgi:hypothetical protein